MRVTWRGVLPAITTPFTADGSVDHAFFAEHCAVLAAAGCTGLVPLGSLGEGPTLTIDEKVALLETAVRSVGERIPIVPGIAALSTHDAVRLARAAEGGGV